MAETTTTPNQTADQTPRDTSYNGWTNYETWVVKLWIDNEQYDQERWLEAAKTAESTGTLADQMQEEYEDATPETVGVWSDLLSAALGEVNWFEIAEHLQEEVIENLRYTISEMGTGSTSSDSVKLDDIVEGVADLLPEKMLEEFEEAAEEDQPDLFEEICNYLNDAAPEHVTFSAHPDDGADWGFWTDDDTEDKEV
jgi:hypothetical protein